MARENFIVTPNEHLTATAEPALPPPDREEASQEQGQTEAQARDAARRQLRQGKTSTALTNLKDAFGDFSGNLRHHAVRATPAIIVNNSSNLLGAAHVYTEILMTKSSIKGKDPKLVHGAKNPIEWTYKAIIKIYKDSFESAFQNRGKGIDVFEGGKPLQNIWKFITDTEAATEREWQTQLAKNPSLTKDKMQIGNNWQTRSTLAGLTVWGLSTIIPDKKESEEEMQRMTIMQKTNPLGYVGERLKQAVWIPDWPNHKRQMIGLGIFVSGVCSILGAWRNRDQSALIPTYKFRGDAFATAIFTFASAFPLLFANNDQRGFAGFGTLMMGRLPFLPGNIAGKLKQGDGGKWYAGASVAFQAENLAQALIGGAEKKPDGTIIDHADARKQAYEKVKEIKRLKNSPGEAMELGAVPETTVQAIGAHEKAMPERVAQHQQEAAAQPA